MIGDKHPTEKVGRNPQLMQEQTTATDSQPVDGGVVNKNQSFIKKLLALPSRAVKAFKGLNRHTQLAIALAVLLLLIAFFAFVFGSGSSTDTNSGSQETSELSQSEAKTAKIIRIDGTLQQKNQDGEWEDIAVDALLEERAVIRTVGATSRAIVQFEDTSELRMDANSEVELITLTDDRIVTRQVSGYSFNRVSENDNRTYVVETIDAQYEALGTAFKVAASGDEQSVEVYQNSVHETSTNKRPAEGEKLVVISAVRPNENNTIKKLDIEQVKQDAFVQWNREIDLASEQYKNQLGYLTDFDAPDITITSPQENEVILLDPDATEGTVEISGTTERGASLSVQSKSTSGSSPVTVTVGSNGEFKTPVLSAPLGSSVFSFIAKDKTGNTTEKSIRFTFQRKSAPVDSGAILLSGEKKGNKISLSWTLSGGLKAPDGYRIVYGTSQNPTVDSADEVQAIQSGKSAEIDTADLSNNSTYYFRVCTFNKDNATCSNYSNEVSIKL